MEIKKIETYSLYEFCQAVQESIIEGWRFDFESNELFPMVKGKTEAPTEDVIDMTKFVSHTPVAIVEDNTEIKRGRKPKDNT